MAKAADPLAALKALAPKAESPEPAAKLRTPQKLKTLRDYIRWGASEFARQGLAFGQGTDNALDEAFHLVLHVLRLPPDLPVVYLEATLAPDERREVSAALMERIHSRTPLAYTMGEIHFCGLPFWVDSRVLIPRSPIAEMIENAFSDLLDAPPKRVLDLCTGSGCIGIAAAHAFPDAEVTLADVSADALIVAARNVARHHCEAQVRIAQGDLFKAVGRSKYDLILSNPPYVPTAEVDALAPEFAHEPRMALEGGADGMDIVARILKDTPKHLTSEGWLVCEIGGSRAEFEARFPHFPAHWPSFERGGDGVFVIQKPALEAWQSNFVSA